MLRVYTEGARLVPPDKGLLRHSGGTHCNGKPRLGSLPNKSATKQTNKRTNEQTNKHTHTHTHVLISYNSVTKRPRIN